LRDNSPRDPEISPLAFRVRRMFTEAMKEVLSFIMKNYLYTFDGQIKLQSIGGPIGLHFTGVLAQLFMVWWDRQIKINLPISSSPLLELRVFTFYLKFTNLTTQVDLLFQPAVALPN